MTPFDITITILALNEGEKLGATLDTVIAACAVTRSLNAEIIVVNDGSTDRTGIIADEFAARFNNIRVIHNTQNLGPGRSVKKALQLASGEKFVVIPGDNDLSYELIHDLLQYANVAEIVMCYFINNEHRGWWRNVLSRIFGLIYVSVFNIFIQYLNGSCVYPTDAVRQLKLFSSRFSIFPEITLKLLRKGLTFVEIPGYVQAGAAGNNSVSMRTFREVVFTFLRLVWEIHWLNRKEFSQIPRRLKIPLQIPEKWLSENAAIKLESKSKIR